MMIKLSLSTCKLLIFLLAVSGRNRVNAQTDNSQCHNDLYLSDQNGDGRVDNEEYVEFCRLRLQERLEIYPEGYTYDIESAPIETKTAPPHPALKAAPVYCLSSQAPFFCDGGCEVSRVD